MYEVAIGRAFCMSWVFVSTEDLLGLHLPGVLWMEQAPCASCARGGFQIQIASWRSPGDRGQLGSLDQRDCYYVTYLP